jgi:hypothetical protein
MLPINTQSQANTEKLILDTLQKQGEEISKQNKNLEKLMYELTRQRRTSEKISTGGKASDSTEGTGIFDMPVKDILKMFKFESGKSIENKNQNFKRTDNREEKDSGKNEESKEEEHNILKSMLDKFTESSEFQKQMFDNSSKLLTITDTMSTNMSAMKDGFDSIKKSYETGEQDNFARKVGVAVAENTIREFSLLLTTKDFKELSEKNTDKLIDALQGLNAGSSGSTNIGGIPGGGNKPGTPGTPKTNIPGTPPPGGGQPPKIPPLAAGSPLLAAGVVTSVIAGGAALTYGATNVLNNMSDEQLQQLSQDTGSDTGLAAQAILSGRATEEEKAAEKKRMEQSKEDLKDAPFLTKYYGIGKEDYMKELEAKKKADADKKRLKELVQQSKDKELNRKTKEEAAVKANPNYTNDVGPQEPLVIPNSLKNLPSGESN